MTSISTSSTSTALVSFSIDSSGKLFYNTSDMCTHKPELFKGFKTKPREIIERKRIPTDEYVFACFNKKTNSWNISDRECKKAQLLIGKLWADDNNLLNILVKTKPTLVKPASVNPPTTVKKPKLVVYESSDDEDDEESDHKKEKEDEVVVNHSSVLPPILELNTDEKFQTVDGEVIEIETRGERSRSKIFFRVKDVMHAFGVLNLGRTLRHKDRGYERGVDFVTFNRCFEGGIAPLETSIKSEESIKNSNPNVLFLTYVGLLRVLFNSKNKHAAQFTAWASDKLFTMQMGTTEDREQLIRVEVDKLDKQRSLLNKHPEGFPCIYLLKLGKAKDLRETFSISDTVDDNLFIYKFGCSIKLHDRISDHLNDYGKLKNVNIEIALYHYVDPIYTSKAEADVRNMFEAYNMRIAVPGRTELVAINKEQYKYVEKSYLQIGREFAGATKEMQEQIRELKSQLMQKEIDCLTQFRIYDQTISDRDKTISDLQLKLVISDRDKTISDMQLKLAMQTSQ